MTLHAKHSTFPVLPTLVGFAAAQFTGYLWYGPIFGKKWMAAMKEQTPDFKVDGDDKAIMGAAAVWFTSSVCFTTLVEYWNRDGLLDLLCLAHTAWLGFSVPGHVFATIFSGQNKTVSMLGASYSLTAFTLMAVTHWLL